jgi:hypothetical protein
VETGNYCQMGNCPSLTIVSVKGLNAQDGGAPATELVAGTGRGGGAWGRAPNGEGGRLERIRVGEEDQFLLASQSTGYKVFKWATSP